MSDTAIETSLSYRTNATIKSILGYGMYRRRNFKCLLPLYTGSGSNRIEKEINKLLSGYPRNHNYKIHNKKLLASFRLYERLRLVTQLYPEHLESFLDIGCCRGFYVLEASQRMNCKTAVGIDVYEPFVSTANKVRQYLDVQNASFYLTSLDKVAYKPEAYGGPFQTVLLIGTYHYLFWGSSLCPTAYYNHWEILSQLFQICTDSLIFSGRLEVDRLPDSVKEKAKMSGNQVDYTTADFLKNAEKLFQVCKAGYLGTYPLFIMSKKKS